MNCMHFLYIAAFFYVVYSQNKETRHIKLYIYNGLQDKPFRTQIMSLLMFAKVDFGILPSEYL